MSAKRRGAASPAPQKAHAQFNAPQPTATAASGKGAPPPSGAVAVDFLRWRGLGKPLLTAIHPERGEIVTAQFDLAQPESIAAWLDSHKNYNLYYHINAVPSPRVEKGEPQKARKADVAAVGFLHVDIDPPASGTTEEWKAATVAALKSYDPPPSTIIFSGNGFNALWRLKAPVALDSNDTIEAVEKRNWRLALDFHTDVATRDVSRVLRIPGTINWPTKAKRKKGWTAKPAEWIEHNDAAFDLSAFRQHDGSAPPKAEAATINLDGVAIIDSLDSLPQLKGEEELREKITKQPDKSEDRSNTVWHVACELVRLGCRDEQIGGILLNRAFGISGHILDQAHPRSYAARQIAKARATVAEWARNDKGIVPNHQGNIATALSKLGCVFGYNVFANRLWVERGGNRKPLNDAVLIDLWLEVDREFRFRPSKDFFIDVALSLARQNEHHPVREYLAALQWDGVKRIDRWLTTYGKAEDDDLTRAVGRLVLVAAVRRVRKPGAEFHEILVLESAQGLLKSAALKTLAVKDEWFSDDLPLNANSKVVIEQTAGKWIIEASELKGLRASEVEHLKNFLSRSSDAARLAYARTTTEAPRHFIVIGTTNSTKYLQDMTGNRRFWPVAVGEFDLAALRRDRDQLWAEAAVAEAAGESIRLSDRLYDAAAKAQEARMLVDPLEETLAPKLEGRTGYVTPDQLWAMSERERGRVTYAESRRLGEVMRRLGWEHRQVWFTPEGAAKKTREYRWLKGTDDEREQPLGL